MIGSIGCHLTFLRYMLQSDMQIAGAISLGQNFGGLEGGEQHFALKAFHRSFDLIRVFMYIPWLAKFFLNFPPPRVLKESRYKALQVKSLYFSICLTSSLPNKPYNVKRVLKSKTVTAQS